MIFLGILLKILDYLGRWGCSGIVLYPKSS